MLNTQLALSEAMMALELIAAPKRPDGTYNRGREACQQLAADTLKKIDGLLQGASRVGAAPVPAQGKPNRLQNELFTPAGAVTEKPAPLPASNQRLSVYTDGGCKGNPGPSGWGVVICDRSTGEVLKEACGFLGRHTNQVAEIRAAIEGLKLTPEGADVELVSDSQYMLKGLSEWRFGWERNGFVNASKQPVANKEHWLELYALADRRIVKTRWVRGHNGDPLNERCDELANKAIRDGVL